MAKSGLYLAKEEDKPRVYETARALNDPRIGGMFETQGGHFILDEKRSKYFLVKDFPVETATPQDLWKRAGEMVNLAARWSMRWFGHVADIAHGNEPPPTHPITLENDPYPRN